MELTLTDKGRKVLETSTDSIEERWLTSIEEGVVGSGENSFNSWQEFKSRYGTFGYDITEKLLKGRYVTLEDIPEMEILFQRGRL